MSRTAIFLLTLTSWVLRIAAFPPAIFATVLLQQWIHSHDSFGTDRLEVLQMAQRDHMNWITNSNASAITVLFFITGFVVFVGIPGSLGFVLVFFSRKLDQKAYDIRALALYKDIVADHCKTFSVYLRPFYVTDRLFESRSETPLTSLSALLKDPYYRLEIQLKKAMRSIGPVVGLGKPGEALGIGRILVNEEDWRAAATKLIDRATYVICIPSSRAGTLWEPDYILEHNFLRKTIFIMPSIPPRKTSRNESDLAGDWAKLAVETGKRGIPIPEYENKNILFCVKSKTSIEKRYFQLSSYRSIRKNIKALLAGSITEEARVGDGG
jgi:hypothetical protein